MANSIFLETPDVSQFHEHNFLPVSHYSGKVNVQIPIYEITSGNIQVPVSLDYDTGGNKVDELSSRIGLGWTLNAGGSIIKIVKGIRDEEFLIENGKSRQGGFMDESKYYLDAIGYHRRIYDYDDTRHFLNQRAAPLPNHENYSTINNGVIENNLLYTTYDIDTSPDLYHVVAPGLNAKFIIVSDDPIDPQSTTVKGEHNFFNRHFKAIFLDDNSLKMDTDSLKYSIYDPENVLYPEFENPEGEACKNHEVRYLEKFKITNSNGLVYEFKLGNVSESDGLATEHSGYVKAGTRVRNYFKSADSWDLHSITNPVTNKSIQFEYEDYQITETEETASLSISAYNQGGLNDYGFLPYLGSLSPKNNVTVKAYPKITRLKKIIFDKGEVEFKYWFNRQDGFDRKALSEIIVRDSEEKKIKGFRLVHDYFQPKESDCSGRYCKRLKLTEVRVVDSEEDFEDQEVLNKYTFTYNENGVLPQSRYSLEKDYMGYYNANNAGYFFANENIYELVDPLPQLYFYPNQSELSLLPFKKKNITNTNQYIQLNNGTGFSLEPNLNGSLITMLNKITYPTGGSLELEYENNQFQFEGYDYNAPGLRIKKQIKNDGNGNTEEFEYEYKEVDGKSSGYFSSIPVFGYITRIYKETDNLVPKDPIYSGSPLLFDIHIQPRSGYELTHGGVIGYSRVIEEQIGNGKIEYQYTSPKLFPYSPPTFDYTDDDPDYWEFLIANTAYPGKNDINQEIKRGKLIQKDVYDNLGNLEFREKRGYEHKNFEAFQTNYYSHVSLGISGMPNFVSSLSEPSHYSFNFEPEDFLPGSFGGRFIITKAPIYAERNILNKIESFSYFDSGVVHEKEEFYNDYRYPFKKFAEKFINDKRVEFTWFRHPYDLNSTEMETLTDLNIINNPVKIETTRGSGKITKEQTYSLIEGLPYPSSLKTIKDDQESFAEVTYDLYDEENGNILQYSIKGEFKIAIIWGYNKTLPIAKIENATYDEISAYVSNLQNLSDEDNDTCIQSENCNENDLRSALNNLRNLPVLSKAQITTYTYDPLIGITSITDPKGYTTYYNYDEFNRLKFIRDSEGNILSQNEYNYAD